MDRMIGTGAVGVMGMGTALLSAVAMSNAKLPLEERESRERKREEARQERFRQAQILQNICPSCEGKLVRGKKDKRNGYKRSWACEKCSESHSI